MGLIQGCYDYDPKLNVNSAEESNFFSSIAAEDGAESFWLGVNDGQEDGTWVQDRIGYSKGM